MIAGVPRKSCFLPNNYLFPVVYLNHPEHYHLPQYHYIYIISYHTKWAPRSGSPYKWPYKRVTWVKLFNPTSKLPSCKSSWHLAARAMTKPQRVLRSLLPGRLHHHAPSWCAHNLLQSLFQWFAEKKSLQKSREEQKTREAIQ